MSPVHIHIPWRALIGQLLATEPQRMSQRRSTRPKHWPELPPAWAPLYAGMCWGLPEEMFTPAYWRLQCWFAEQEPGEPAYRLGRTLREETAACLLGGYGMAAEIGLAAFETLRDSGLLGSDKVTACQLHDVLRRPMQVGNRMPRMRFAMRKSAYLADALAALRDSSPPDHDDVAFRSWFLNLRGIGWKTASWITRNWLSSEAVAILDVHICRAGVIAGFFPQSFDLNRDYLRLESAFLTFAGALEVSPALLDSVMWRDMRTVGHLGRQLDPRAMQ